ncbi:MAG TPA: integrin alpha, partial [Candidatus Polarisedimenticolaceae bacterium]|nr:integrin alpha [Candidatus Polarisedimenticolaceae bacterium]
LDELSSMQLDLASLSACASPDACGIAFTAAGGGDEAGWSLSYAGDIDHDGHDDLLIGAPGASPAGRAQAGAVYLIYGPLEAGTIDLSEVGDPSMPGIETRGLRFDGENPGDRAGEAVSWWEDVNADGVDDLLIGAPGATLLDPTGTPVAGAGIVYAIHGGTRNLDDSATPGVIELSRVANTEPDEVTGVVFLGSAEHRHAGASVTGAADTDGDEEPDIYIGGDDEVWFISGLDPKTTSGSSPMDRDRGGVGLSRMIRVLGPGSVADVFPATAFVAGSDGDLGPLTVGPAGDIDGDGIDDVVIGAAEADPAGRVDAGKAYLVLGSRVRREAVVELSEVGRTIPGLVIDGSEAGDALGRSVGGGFDVNGDGIDDGLVGAPLADSRPDTPPDAGEAYVISPVAPGEVPGLQLSRGPVATELEWVPPHRALRYNVYRGTLADLRAAGVVRTSDVPGTFECALNTDADGDGLPDTVDSQTPSPGEGYLYLVSGRNLSGEGPLGPLPAARINDGQCP